MEAGSSVWRVLIFFHFEGLAVFVACLVLDFPKGASSVDRRAD